MTAFRFYPVTPHPLLAPYVARMCVFESSGRLPAQDMKLIVPNATLKLTLTYRNGIVASVGDKTFIQGEHEISLTGLIDRPVILDPRDDVPTGTIIIEFNQSGAYRLFRLSYADIKNQILQLPDLVGKTAAQLQRQLADAESLEEKLQLLQTFLLKRLEQAAPDNIYDYCINRISTAKGLVSIAQLEKETGYSARWLHRKFTEHLGTGAKNLAELVRFRQFYHAYSTGADAHTLKQYIYEYYYDQSHFLRAFKRFTGHTPTGLQNSMNELAQKHYTGS